MTELIARRQFMPMYIWLDIAFLIVLAVLLLYKKKYMTTLVGLVMGIVYMLVDYGIFHLVCRARSVQFILGIALDVYELRLYEFYMDLVVAFKRQTSF